MQCSCRRKTCLLGQHRVIAMVMAAIVGGGAAWADVPIDPLRIHQTQSEAIAISQQTQQAEDRWAEEKTALQARYRTLQAEEKNLIKRHASLLAQVSAIQARQAEAQRTIAETARVGDELQPHLDALVTRLEAHIDRDLPFLPIERAQRMADIKTVLTQPDTSIAERSRRVMEAIKIETEYGQTVEVYQETIYLGGQEKDHAIVADILRVGRLALFWRSPDGKTVGQWDRVANGWTRLPDTYRRSINDAVEMALKRRTIDLVKLPLGRIAQQ
ncbi:DUF3450 domain-containing protein [Desulfosarcina ovata subsp. sediminis]|uniref:DUF3450 domain-containing protein n=1 Tax=Desulfosarcina ovata subsp. sediminis TaxID=885957 RepID=A0A5K7ZZ74_9BACT|nr:DUF3450 domain-containing protein [Desulfosarcina ovata]BBO85466.1 DUF3450 domain-containing protein [Desulfosarcina ovata subsp. sediminis]